MPDDKTREELIREKTAAGLTREQALEVIERQAEADKTARKTAKEK